MYACTRSGLFSTWHAPRRAVETKDRTDKKWGMDGNLRRSQISLQETVYINF